VSTAFKYWVAFLFTSFAVSVLTLSLVQTKLIRHDGWRVFHTRSIIELYWREIPLLQRFLIWTGIAALLLTFFALAVDALLRHI